MKTRNRVLIWALPFALTAGLAMAQSESKQESDSGSGESSDAVYTMEDLKKLGEGDSPSVYTNESLDETEAEQTPAPGESYSNKDLSERFGNEGAGPAEKKEAGEAESAEAPAAGTEPAEPAMSAEEREKHVAEIDAELARLERRLMAIRNPLLAGTEKPTADEAGLDNVERLRRTEEKIEELRKVLDELREN